MSFIFYAVALVLLASLAVMTRGMNRAPDAFEDTFGFHLGAPPSGYSTDTVPPMVLDPTAPSYDEAPDRTVAA